MFSHSMEPLGAKCGGTQHSQNNDPDLDQLRDVGAGSAPFVVLPLQWEEFGLGNPGVAMDNVLKGGGRALRSYGSRRPTCCK